MAEHVVELVRHRRHPALAGLVAGIVGSHECAPGAVRRRQPAGSLIPLMLSFGSPLNIVALSEGKGDGRSYGSFVAGLMPGHASTTFERSQNWVQVYLTPRGAHRILGVPGRRLAQRVTAVDDIEHIAPILGGTLPDRLHSTGVWRERIAVVEDALLRLAGIGHEPDDFVIWMWQAILASGGQAQIADLVRCTGWSHRHVTTRFRDQFGLTPKAIAGIVRFERAHAELATLPLADVAARHGYADQSHLTREVRRHAGEAPLALGRARRPTAYTALGVDPSQAS